MSAATAAASAAPEIARVTGRWVMIAGRATAPQEAQLQHEVSVTASSTQRLLRNRRTWEAQRERLCMHLARRRRRDAAKAELCGLWTHEHCEADGKKSEQRGKRGVTGSRGLRTHVRAVDRHCQEVACGASGASGASGAGCEGGWLGRLWSDEQAEVCAGWTDMVLK